MSDNIYDIPADLLAKAEQSQSFKLRIPDTARRHRRDPKTFFWPEGGVITSGSSGSYAIQEPNEGAGQHVSTLELNIEVNAEGSGLNTNQPLTTTFRINYDSLKNGEPKKQQTMSLMSINKLRKLFSILGIEGDLQGGGFSTNLLTHYFPPATDQFPTETSPLVGTGLYFEVKQGPRELPDGSIRENPEVNAFLSESEFTGGK